MRHVSTRVLLQVNAMSPTTCALPSFLLFSSGQMLIFSSHLTSFLFLTLKRKYLPVENDTMTRHFLFGTKLLLPFDKAGPIRGLKRLRRRAGHAIAHPASLECLGSFKGNNDIVQANSVFGAVSGLR